MISSTQDVRFSVASIDLLYRIKQSAYRHASDRAVEHARVAGRDLVTEADVLAGLRAAMEEAAAAELQSDDGQPSKIAAEEAVPA